MEDIICRKDGMFCLMVEKTVTDPAGKVRCHSWLTAQDPGRRSYTMHTTRETEEWLNSEKTVDTRVEMDDIFAYDAQMRLIRRREILYRDCGRKTVTRYRYEYDRSGKLVRSSLDSFRDRYYYDDKGRLALRKRWEDGRLRRTIEWEYDERNGLVSAEKEGDWLDISEYDGRGLLVREIRRNKTKFYYEKRHSYQDGLRVFTRITSFPYPPKEKLIYYYYDERGLLRRTESIDDLEPGACDETNKPSAERHGFEITEYRYSEPVAAPMG